MYLICFFFKVVLHDSVAPMAKSYLTCAYFALGLLLSLFHDAKRGNTELCGRDQVQGAYAYVLNAMLVKYDGILAGARMLNVDGACDRWKMN